MGGTEYLGETAVQPRDHIPVNTMRKSHNHTLSRHWYDYPQPHIIFSRLTYDDNNINNDDNNNWWMVDGHTNLRVLDIF